MKEVFDLEEELRFLGLLDKAREIHAELGEDAVLSYIKSSHRLLSKVYHPDLNPGNEEKAMRTQQRLNRVSDFIGRMPDRDLINLIRAGSREGTRRKRRILVVEDEFGLQDMFRSIFIYFCKTKYNAYRILMGLGRDEVEARMAERSMKDFQFLKDMRSTSLGPEAYL